jgi:hypothetical protein
VSSDNSELIPAFGRRKLDAIREEHVDAFVAQELKLGVSRKTINIVSASIVDFLLAHPKE